MNQARRFSRIGFGAGLVFAFVMATLPRPPTLPLASGELSQHILAFAVLTGLAVLGWPKVRYWILFVGLAAYGGLIELVQTIPALHRDGDLGDWLVDCLAIAAVLALTLALRRLSARPRGEGPTV